MHDVIVVGAGPAGSLVAKSLAERDYDVLIIEEHRTPGLPQHGNGLVTDETIAMSGVSPEIYSSISGFEITFPNEATLTVRSDTPKLKMVNLADMEKKMSDAAIDAGAGLMFEDTYESHTTGDRILVDSTSGIHRCRLLVGADGAHSKVAMSLGDNRPPEYIRGIQVNIDYRMEDQETCKIYLGKNVAPGFMAWQIPCGDFTRVGLCTSWSAGDPTTYLSDLLIKLGFQDKIMSLFTGKVPLGERPIICGDRCVLVGDAAGFVDPLTARGLNYAFRCNEHLMKTLPSCLDTDTLFYRDLDAYDRLYRKDIGNEIVKLRELRRRYKKISDSDFNSIHKMVDETKANEAFKDLDFNKPLEAVDMFSNRLGLRRSLFLRSII